MLGTFFFVVALAISAATAPETEGADTRSATVQLPAADSGVALMAEPQVATGKFTTALEVKPILNATVGNWIAVREYDGQDLIYVTHLWSWRCGLVELRIGLNGETPQPWDLPPCHSDQPVPNMMAEEDGLPYKVFPLNSVDKVEVLITYDDLTTQSAVYDWQGVLIP